MGHLANGAEVITPTAEEAAIARESGKKLAAHLDDSGGLRLEMKSGKKSEEIVLPHSALRLLVGVLTELAQGNAVTLTPLRAELTTQRAADILNVSRPYLVKLLDEGAIPSRKVGSHRRVQLIDVLSYKKEMLARRHAVLDELTALSQELDMGY